ncbi:MAG: AAA family ATPase [Chloroflexi bacterium]|nr:AAA family ATPase [Chloroflexota bacterium]
MASSSAGEEFGDLLGRYLTEARTSVRRLEALSGVSRRTMENWLHGPVRRPRHWEPVLRVAHALHLPAADTDALLRAAGLPPLSALRVSGLSRAQLELMMRWAAPQSPDAPLPPGNLPAPLTPFVGRDGELAELVAALGASGARLVTLSGEGGSGKTRLALQAAGALRAAFPDGAWLVELDALSDPSLIPSAVASALGLVEDRNRPSLDAPIDFLAGRRALLLLDNCEHLVAAAADTAHQLLRRCPRLLILATSRERLGVSGETVWLVPAMTLPPPDATDPAELAQYDAVRLFVARAAVALPGFALTPDNAAAVAQVCRRLDGIPLALELAAARVRRLRVEQIAARLDDRFTLLTGGDRTATPRQQTLRGLIDWSHDLLPPHEQRLLRRLSVFAGGFTPAAAEAICDPEGEGGVPDALEMLADKSLVVAARAAGSEARYSLHETIRHYGREKLRDAGETADMQTRHAAYYTQLLEDALPRTDYDDRWFERLAWLEAEHGNWSAMLNRALGAGTIDAAWGVRVAARLAPFWLMHGRLIEGRLHMQAALDRAGAAPPAIRAALTLWMATLMIREWEPRGKALAARGVALFRQLDDPTGVAWGLIVLSLSDLNARETAAQPAEALALAEAAGDDCLRMGAHYVLARLALRAGSFDEAATNGERALALARATGNRLREPYLLRVLGVIASWHGDSPRARSRFDEALALTRELHVQGWMQAHILNSLGEDARRHGDFDGALAHYRAALEMATRIGDRFLMMGEQLNMGLVLVRDGDAAEGEALLRRNLREHARIGLINSNIVWNLWGLAVAATRRGDPEQAARLYGGAARLSETTGFAVAPADRALYETDIAATQTALGDTAFAAAWAEGEALGWEEMTTTDPLTH